jgi:1-acyl-sn-glycerol-3-phosphate acyltransferase
MRIADRAGAVVSDGDVVSIYTLGDLVDRVGPPPNPNEPGRGGDLSQLLDARTTADPPSPLTRPARWSWPVLRAIRAACWAYARARLDLEVRGGERVDWSCPRMIVAQNHQSHLDPVLLALALPRAVHRRALFLGFTGYYGRGLARAAARLLRIQPISADAGLLVGIRVAAAAVRAGQVLCLYPEGERSWDGTLRPFRRGVALLARHGQAAVVPTAIAGAYAAWPRGGAFRPNPVRIAFGEPLDPPHAKGGPAEDQRFLAALRGRIGALMRELGADPERGEPEVWARTGAGLPRLRPGDSLTRPTGTHS